MGVKTLPYTGNVLNRVEEIVCWKGPFGTCRMCDVPKKTKSQMIKSIVSERS